MSRQENLEESETTRNEKVESSPDLTDVVNLFTTVIKNQFDELTEKLHSEQSQISDISQKKVKDIGSKLKSEGNKIQYEFNDDLKEKILKLEKIAKGKGDNISLSIINEIIHDIDLRNKHIRIADSSPAGWKTVNEYKTNDIAEDSDDERKIRSAENRALKSIKQYRIKYRQQPYRGFSGNRSYVSAAAGSAAQLATQSSNPFGAIQPFLVYPQSQQVFFRGKQRTPQPSDICFKCFKYGHRKNRCPAGNNDLSTAQQK